MTNAEFARKQFFDTLQRELDAQGNPFFFTRGRQWAIIGRTTASFHEPCVAIDFLYQKEFLRINVYIEDDIPLYLSFKRRREEIEEKLGFRCVWDEKCEKGNNTRRIAYAGDMTFDQDYIDYRALAQKAIPIIKSFIETFHDVLDC